MRLKSVVCFKSVVLRRLFQENLSYCKMHTNLDLIEYFGVNKFQDAKHRPRTVWFCD